MVDNIDYQEYQKIISSIARKMTSDKELQKDLIQEGYVGLLKAKKNYNPTFGVKFLTYAYPYIKDHISRYYNESKQEENEVYNEELDCDYSFNLDSVCFDDIDNFLEDCSEDTKKIIHLIIDKGMSYREIAEQLGYSKSKISYILSKEKDKLYKKLRK